LAGVRFFIIFGQFSYKMNYLHSNNIIMRKITLFAIFAFVSLVGLQAVDMSGLISTALPKEWPPIISFCPNSVAALW
jgi:hypothetical protein